MLNHLEDIFELVNTLSLSLDEREQLLGALQDLQKRYQRLDFMLKRTLKDKSIAINLLNQTIEDLQKKQAYIEITNQQLSAQKKEIEEKNQLLEKQSIILQENLENIEWSYLELERLAYIASHDLKIPLGSIISFAKLLQRSANHKLTGEAQELVHHILTSADQMDSIIQALLIYSRAGRRDKQFETTDLKNTLEVAKYNLRKKIDLQKVLITQEGLPTLSVVKSDIIKLFEQLLDNAIKFRSEQAPEIHILASKEGAYWHFQFMDNGIGLDKEKQKGIFQPFQKIADQNSEGNGIGLAVCSKIVRLHKGKIWIESTPSKGSTIHFTLSTNPLD